MATIDETKFVETGDYNPLDLPREGSILRITTASGKQIAVYTVTAVMGFTMTAKLEKVLKEAAQPQP
jgi:hypothetical protein